MSESSLVVALYIYLYVHVVHKLSAILRLFCKQITHEYIIMNVSVT